MIQDYNTLQSQVLSGLQKGSSSPGKGKGKEKEKLDLNDRWREVERELDEFSGVIDNGTEREKQLSEKCRRFPLQVRRTPTSPNDVTDCPSSNPARQPEANPLEVQSVHPPGATAHRRDVRYAGSTAGLTARSLLVIVRVRRSCDVVAEFVKGPREGGREEAWTARSWRGCSDQRGHGDPGPAA